MKTFKLTYRIRKNYYYNKQITVRAHSLRGARIVAQRSLASMGYEVIRQIS